MSAIKRQRCLKNKPSGENINLHIKDILPLEACVLFGHAGYGAFYERSGETFAHAGTDD